MRVVNDSNFIEGASGKQSRHAASVDCLPDAPAGQILGGLNAD